MNILVVFTYNYSLSTWSKSGTFFKEIETYKLLSEKGLKFTFITYSENEPHLDLLEKYNIKVIPVYSIIKKSNNRLLDYIKSFIIPFVLRNKLKDIDIIKQNQLHGSWVAIILKLLLRKPLFIRTGYDMYAFSIKENKSPFIKFLYKWLTKFSINYSDLYSVSSVSDLNFIKANFDINEKNIKIRPNWVKEIKYNNLDNRFENKIIAIGRLEEQKNYHYLISSFSGSNFEIDLVGEGSLKNELKDYATIQNTKVNFLGKLSNEEIINMLSQYKYYISTSIFEGNPKSTLEALSVGCVVFATDIPNHQELINDQFNGFLFPVDKDLNEIFRKALKKPLSEVSLNARSNVLKNNSIKLCVENEFNDLNSINYY